MGVKRRQQIRFRIWLAIMLISAMVLVATFGVALYQQANYFKSYMKSNYLSTAKIVSANSSVAINFDDREVVDDLLKSMKDDKNVQSVVIYDATGKVFASRKFINAKDSASKYIDEKTFTSNDLEQIFSIKNISKQRNTASQLFDDQLIIIDPILFSDQYIGLVVLRISLLGIYGNIADYLISMLPLLVVILLAIFIVTRFVSKTITKPLYSLLDGIMQVKKNKDYGLRLSIIQADEVGELTRSFNGMLAEIERRDQELIAHRDDLTVAVEERTAELQFATKNALASADVAKKAMQAKSNFLARVSHEIRTPINGVLGITELFHDTEIDQKQVGYINAISSSTRQLLTIVNDILDHAKIESGNFQIDLRPCYIKRIIESSVSTMRARAFEKNLTIKYELSEAVIEPLMGDPNRIEQIINNLISNAIKFSSNGEINISVCEDKDKKGFVYFAVTDHGIGIDDDKQQLIFDSFTQADGSICREYGGTGLGLTICKDLTHIMGGQINVTSEPGNGSTFYFSIPMSGIVAGESRDKYNISNDEDESINLQFVSKPNLLLVEDNEVNILVGTGLLQLLGCDVTCANDGKQAVTLAGDKRYDLIIMDCHMPVMNGFDAAEAIRRESRCRDVPIVALTADVTDGIIGRCRRAGMQDYMSKPYSKNCISRLLKQILIDGQGAISSSQISNYPPKDDHEANTVGLDTQDQEIPR